jgi:hypothetical protein
MNFLQDERDKRHIAAPGSWTTLKSELIKVKGKYYTESRNNILLQDITEQFLGSLF